jgi:phosphotriesterase-related protein
MIYTVNGPITKEDMGITLGHEHFKWEEQDSVALSLYYNRDYSVTDVEKDFELLLPILSDLKTAGVSTVVEASPPAGGQNLLLLRKLSLATGIHVIPATGWNAPHEIYQLVGDGYAEILAKRWIHDFNYGLDTIDDVTIKPGYIKLLMPRGDIQKHDKALLKAAAIASKQTGMPIHCHILEANQVMGILDFMEELGLDLNKFLWAHADLEGNLEVIKATHQRGCWIGLDTIRRDVQQNRAELLLKLIQLGLDNRVMLSQDYEFYVEAVKDLQNHPCTSLLIEFVPLCEQIGVEQLKLKTILRNHPAEFYDIVS